MTPRLASPLFRFSAFGLLAIVLPAAILAALGYVSLRQWETSAELLLRAQARHLASMMTEKVEMLLSHTEDEILNRIETILRRPDFTPGALNEVGVTMPFVERLYLVDRRGRLLFPAALTGGDVGVVPKVLVEMSQSFWERGGRRNLVIGDQIIVAAVLTAESVPLLVAFSRNADVLRREIFEKTLRTVEGPTIVAVLDEHGHAVYSRASLDRAEQVATASFGAALPSWRVALYQPPGMSLRAAVRRQTTIFAIAFGLLLVVIVGGLVTTYRLVKRETEMARLKADFVANVSHDLKTPLSLIRMYGETLQMGRVGDEATRQEYYRVITRETERLSRLIDNVLDFSRIDGGRRQYDIALTALEPVIRETLEAFEYVLSQQGFKVDVAVPPDLPAAPLDAEAVSQALANLLDNAIKYSDKVKTLRIEARIEGNALAISVTDAGIGIPPAEQSKIFEKFYRVGRSETQGRRGSGVGLALVRHVVLAHGGRVTVESRPGEGSRFTLWFPLRHEAG